MSQDVSICLLTLTDTAVSILVILYPHEHQAGRFAREPVLPNSSPCH